ncbi:hypothetical protein Patl1_18932 [Pistacia atlantica]|uniref:Uncharacterized protein n=1 Tax=Pistacia atlantica TaxID=434234 RepID=A0ACC1BY11_9ROSI|nr:hypothetical protein Patl1_18932 [Pistacia atlantica]
MWLSKQWNRFWELCKVSTFLYLFLHVSPSLLFLNLSQNMSSWFLSSDMFSLMMSCSPKSPHLASVVSAPGKAVTKPMVQCTSHMCPVRVHWHVKLNYKEYWRVKITITNFNYAMNYSQWNIVAQHPNFDNLTELFSFNYKPLTPYEGLNDTAMLWGLKFYNDFLSEAGPYGNVQSELLFRKDASTFTFEKGWAFPRRIYFNGDNCVMPPPDAYPWLPNASSRPIISLFQLAMTILASLALLVAYA